MAIAGLTIEQATKKITQTLQRSGYATLGTGETKLQLSVTQFRTFPVTVIGAKASGTYMVSSVANVFHALHMAGGPAKRGTYRDIELIRKGQIIQYVDLYSFMVDGNQLQFLNLQENDIINIPAYDTRVTLKGEALRPLLTRKGFILKRFPSMNSSAGTLKKLALMLISLKMVMWFISDRS
jgi:protein involved in polysaccharide export with SLBB domain